MSVTFTDRARTMLHHTKLHKKPLELNGKSKKFIDTSQTGGSWLKLLQKTSDFSILRKSYSKDISSSTHISQTNNPARTIQPELNNDKIRPSGKKKFNQNLTQNPQNILSLIAQAKQCKHESNSQQFQQKKVKRSCQYKNQKTNKQNLKKIKHKRKNQSKNNKTYAPQYQKYQERFQYSINSNFNQRLNTSPHLINDEILYKKKKIMSNHIDFKSQIEINQQIDKPRSVQPSLSPSSRVGSPSPSELKRFTATSPMIQSDRQMRSGKKLFQNIQNIVGNVKGNSRMQTPVSQLQKSSFIKDIFKSQIKLG